MVDRSRKALLENLNPDFLDPLAQLTLMIQVRRQLAEVNMVERSLDFSSVL